MISYDKTRIKESLTLDNIFDLLQEWGGDPKYTSFGILSATICHNYPGEGSHKLYFYSNSGLFRCYTGCDSYFDIFELARKVALIQKSLNWDLNDAVRWVAQRFGLSGTVEDIPDINSEDWIYLNNYERIQEIEPKEQIEVILKEYDRSILDRFNYQMKITPWIKEGITQDVLHNALIGYYPGGDQITIPHFDINDRFIGLRGRTLCADEGELYGKYRPIKVNQQWYNHPLGMNLYGLNWNKEAIKTMRTAIIFEGEKSVLKYASNFGWENNISVACCGSAISSYQIELLREQGVQEIAIAFDRQFKEIGDEEFKHLKNNLIKTREKYKNDLTISFVFDKHMLTGYKDSPIDAGPDTFLQLFKERIFL
jgi:hypothetical protein